jgi:hypothetical protein
MKKMNFYISDPQVSFLEKQSKKLDISISEILRRILEEYMKEKK